MPESSASVQRNGVRARSAPRVATSGTRIHRPLSDLARDQRWRLDNLVDQVERAVLRLFEDPCDVLTDDAETEQLKAPDQEEEDDQGRPPGNRLVRREANQRVHRVSDAENDHRGPDSAHEA